jgi:hypothetical protein
LRLDQRGNAPAQAATNLKPVNPVAVARPNARACLSNRYSPALLPLASIVFSGLPSHWAGIDAARAIAHDSPSRFLLAIEIASKAVLGLAGERWPFPATLAPATAHHAPYGPFAAVLGLSAIANRFGLAATLARDTARSGQERSRARDDPTARPGARDDPQAARSGQERPGTQPARAPPIRTRDGPTCRGMVATSVKLAGSMLGAWSRHAAICQQSSGMLLPSRYLAASWAQDSSMLLDGSKLATSWPQAGRKLAAIQVPGAKFKGATECDNRGRNGANQLRLIDRSRALAETPCKLCKSAVCHSYLILNELLAGVLGQAFHIDLAKTNLLCLYCPRPPITVYPPAAGFLFKTGGHISNEISQKKRAVPLSRHGP